MASIQILELRPLEAQVEDLSYDMTGSIMGGGDIDCVVEFVNDFIDAFTSGNLDLIPGILVTYLSCIEAEPGIII